MRPPLTSRLLALAASAGLAVAAPRAAEPPSCKSMCANLARCKIQEKAPCLEMCKRERVEQQPNAEELLGMLGSASCEDLQAAKQRDDEQQAAAQGAQPQGHPAQQQPAQPQQAQQEPQPGGHRPGWQCWASGTWKKSCQPGVFCPDRIQSSFGFGDTQLQAQLSAEAVCTQGMTNLMLASFGGRVVFPCKATQCTQR